MQFIPVTESVVVPSGRKWAGEDRGFYPRVISYSPIISLAQNYYGAGMLSLPTPPLQTQEPPLIGMSFTSNAFYLHTQENFASFEQFFISFSRM